MFRRRGHVRLKPLDEVKERRVTLLDTADELFDTVLVDGRFPIRYSEARIGGWEGGDIL